MNDNITYWLNMGDALFYGREGAVRDPEKAKHWFEMAANEGSLIAKEMLEKHYNASSASKESNSKVKNDQLKQSSNNSGASDNVEYWLYMGNALFYGREGAIKDSQKAKIWFEKAAAAGNEEAKEMLKAYSGGPFELNGNADKCVNVKDMPGIVNGIELNTVNNYAEEKFHGERGHGFAAERANTMYDRLMGKDAQVVGDDNAKNGADRIVDGANIQSKYCKSGSKCVQECFENGKFRYYNSDGSPMQIEVPSDKYEDALKAMQNRIDRGEIQGVKDAKEIIRKGNFTYEQAKNIAKAGTIESLTYDAYNGAITAAYSGGISSAITFFCSYRSGKSFEESLDDAVKAGIQVGGISFAGAVLSGQMTKAGLNTLLVGNTDAIVSKIGPKAAARLVNAFRSGTSIYGAAAMKSASKLLRSNAVTGIATVVVLSAGDVLNIFRGRISFAQLFKNVVNTGAGVAGGVGGWGAGATLGATLGSIVPGFGTTIGGVVGGIAGALLGGSAASSVSETVMDGLIEDDSKEMIRILEGEFQEIAVDYLLNEKEAEAVADNLKEKVDASTLKDMYASNNQEKFAHELIVPCADTVVKKRPKVQLPSDEDLIRGLREVLETV